MSTILTDNRRTILVGVVAYAVGLGFTQTLRPAAPAGVLVGGLFQALPAALAAAALVLVYRSVRIINFAHFALGTVAAQLFYEFYAGKELVPYPVALLIGLTLGPLIGLVVGIIFATLFFRHPRLVLTVGTILITGLVAYIQGELDGVFHKPGEIRNFPPVIGPLPDVKWNIGGTPFRISHLVSFVLLVGVSLGLVVFFRRTRVGMAVRAAAENSDRASLLGINVKLLQVGVWTLVGFISSVGAVGQLSVVQYSPVSGFDFLVLLLPLSAAVLARMSSMPKAFFAALGLSLLRTAVQFSAPTVAALSDIGLFAIIMAGLLIQRKKMHARIDEGSSWRAVKEIRPTPRELLALPAVARTRRAVLLIVGALVLAFPWIVGHRTIEIFAVIWTTSIIAVSLVILTGWSGQISLGQFALVTVGAFVSGNMTSRWGIPFWFAVPLAGVVGAAFAALIGVPALRIRGLFLAVSTFAIAAVMPLLIFDPTFLGNWLPEVERPRLFFLDFRDGRSMYYLLLGAFVVVVAGVQSLRRSRAGRVLIALRDNEAGAQSFGVDVVRTRLAAFAVSGFIAAVGGALLVHQSLGMDRLSFDSRRSVELFILVVIGGVSSVMGATLGSIYFITSFFLFPGLAQVLSGVLGIVVLMFIPGGLTQVVFGTRDAILRVIAMRQHIIVPSLFADYSPEAWEKRLVPLAPAVQTQGLAALRPDQRYARPSKVLGKPAYDVGPPAWEGR